MKLLILKIIFISSIISLANCLGFIQDLIQYNVAGIPSLHKTLSFPFDPDEASKRSVYYQARYGRYGEKAIESLGLGDDGLQLQRLAEQRKRDEGELGGVRELSQ